MKQTYQTGVNGEREAEAYLCDEKGMQCLERRFRSRHGEIDLILRDGETIVFAEVKTRKSGVEGSGLMSVTPAKQKRIAQAATVYLMTHHQLNFPVRFDVIEIFQERITYIPNAFQPGGVFYR